MRGATLLALALAACASRPNPAEAPAPLVVAPLPPPQPADPVAPCVGGSCPLPPPAYILPKAPQAPVLASVAPVAQPAPAAAQQAPTPLVPAQSLPEAAVSCQWDYLWWLAGAMAVVGVALWIGHRWGRLPPLLPAVLALLLAGCQGSNGELAGTFRVVITAPTPPAEPFTPVPLLWTGGVALAVVGVVLFFLRRRKP